MRVEMRKDQSSQAERAWATRPRLRGGKRKTKVEKGLHSPKCFFPIQGEALKARETPLDLNSARPLLHGWGSNCHVVFISGLHIDAPPGHT